MIVAIAVCCGEVDGSRVCGSEVEARTWSAGFLAGAEAFGGDEASVFVLPGDEEELEERSLHVRSEVEREVARLAAGGA